MSELYIIGEKPLTVSEISRIISKKIKIKLSQFSKEKVVFCRNYLDNKIENSTHPIYGINTGFGSLYNHKICDKDLEQLQKNLVLSHACGTGDEVPTEIVKIILLLKSTN